MATWTRFEDIEAWKKARQLARQVYDLSRQGAFAKDYGLRDQIRRAVVSVMANIAEGFDRDGSREFIQFLSVAKASASEVQSHLYVAFDQRYIGESDFGKSYALAGESARLIGGLIRYLETANHRGRKYKTRDSQLETGNSKLETPVPIAIAVVLRAGSVLIGQRDHDKFLAGCWEFPGGKIQPDEMLSGGAARECREETGLGVEVGELLSDVEFDYPHGRLRLFFFECRPLDDAVLPRVPFRWVPISDLPKYQFPPANEAVLKMLAERERSK